MNANDRAEVAKILRRLLDRVESGDLTADDPQSRAAVHHLRGAAVAFDLSAKRKLSRDA